ncbi:MAG: MlaD family protein [Verrucomicrobia bacterium]|jgi:phospholipid/cholesterol/gamma-HCH transport system substrate-binding protein|nr:MlaD family protein [Verrucomicrobiota bacterium]
MKNTLETRVGLFVALIALAAVLIIEILGGIERFGTGRQVQAMFTTVQELKIGDRVKMAGVEVGRVAEIQLTNHAVHVTMRLHRDAVVRTDSVATIKFAGLLGQNFVNLSFGSPAAPLADSTTYLASEEQPDFNVIMKKLENVASGVENMTKSFSGEEIGNLIGPFTDFLKQNKEPLSLTISNISQITGRISSGQGTVGKLIYDEALHASALTTLTDLQKAVSEFQPTLADARSIMADVKAGQGSVGKLLREDTLYNETTASMTNLREILEKINRGDGSVGKLVNDQEFYNNAKLTLQKVEKSVESLEDTGPLSVLGMAVGSLF